MKPGGGRQEAGGAKAALEEAYRRALYCVRLAGGELVLRVGEYRSEHDLRLRSEAGVQSHWAIVTPCNPGSARLEPAQNSARLEQMAEDLRRHELRSAPSLNRDPLGRWPDEAGFLLCDAGPGVPEQLARQFGQNAIVSACLGEAPGLIWLA
ncbi:MAG: DUF3293 domain-containing protein [Nevskia sp.]|nr:DUF3293 domain-containing protein [Nevskia sp.]